MLFTYLLCTPCFELNRPFKCSYVHGVCVCVPIALQPRVLAAAFVASSPNGLIRDSSFAVYGRSIDKHHYWGPFGCCRCGTNLSALLQSRRCHNTSHNAAQRPHLLGDLATSALCITLPKRRLTDLAGTASSASPRRGSNDVCITWSQRCIIEIMGKQTRARGVCEVSWRLCWW